MAIYTSRKNFLGIDVFMTNYLQFPYQGNCKLTHGEMMRYLQAKGKVCPVKAPFQHVGKDSISRGDILIVRDETGQRIAYHNPRKNVGSLLDELKACSNRKDLESIRREILAETDHILLQNGEILNQDEYQYEEEEKMMDRKDRKVLRKTRRTVMMRGR